MESEQETSVDWIKDMVQSSIWQETPEEGQRTHQLKCYEYNYKDEDNSAKILNHKTDLFLILLTLFPLWKSTKYSRFKVHFPLVNHFCFPLYYSYPSFIFLPCFFSLSYIATHFQNGRQVHLAVCKMKSKMEQFFLVWIDKAKQGTAKNQQQ